ncbi:hypothetical protein AWC19_11125 [Mycobacterium palustre]|uniref:Uncharacterized protein n=1 Tax=Mycobacterium palustre TaxID=153971 RepID=A0A1X1ZJS9_9MYCO|nr:hypothetical protein AWC19_11125 [Mycobacterium palustre]
MVEQPNLLHMVSSPDTLLFHGQRRRGGPRRAHTARLEHGLTQLVLSEVVVALGAWSRRPDVSDANRRFGCIL